MGDPAGMVDGIASLREARSVIGHSAEPPVSQGRWKQNLWASRTAETLDEGAEQNELAAPLRSRGAEAAPPAPPVTVNDSVVNSRTAHPGGWAGSHQIREGAPQQRRYTSAGGLREKPTANSAWHTIASLREATRIFFKNPPLEKKIQW